MSNIFGNLIEPDDLKTNLIEAFSELESILIEHSGPYASNCVIGSKWRQVNDVDEFSKDGIKILRHLIVSEDPAARFAARMARFVGISVDSRCHDGTTTSMLLFCRLAIVAVAEMTSDPLLKEQYIWSKKLNTVLDLCLDYLESLKITEDDLLERCAQFSIDTNIDEIRESIAYHMAMISSKGDHDLSTKIGAMIKASPRKIYGMFKDIPTAVETSEAYILKKQEYDLAVNANIGSVSDYNHKNDTQYLSDNAVIFATGNDIVTDSMESLFLTAFISKDPRHRGNLSEFGDIKGWEDFHEGKKNLIIMSPLVNDGNLINAILLFNMVNPHVRISWFNIQVHSRMRTSFNKTLHYMAGVPIFKDVNQNAVSSLVGLQETNVKVQFIGHTITISNLYEKDGEVYHPLYREPDLYKPYSDFARETEELITFASENITNPALDHDEVTFLISLYRSLTLQTIYDIEIGGSVHDQYANRTVYEDAIGAALSAVNEGIVLGGYAHLLNYCTYQENPDLEVMFRNFADQLLEITLGSLREDSDNKEICQFVIEGSADKWEYIVADTKHLNLCKNSLDELSLKLFLQRTPEMTFLLQAYAGYNEQFRRFKDILPKLANTAHLADMRIKEDSDVR